MIFLKYINYACKIIVLPKKIPTQNCFYLEIHFLSSTTNVILHPLGPLNTHFSRLIHFSRNSVRTHLRSYLKARVPPGYPNTRKQLTNVFIHCFLVLGYPGETLAMVVQILREMLWSGVAYRTRTVLRILLGLQMIHY